ncbi:MAG: zf-HC2 domain-containing protein [Pyrinomonadaceae bacterium]|nr:zf-HC2 domain-containing protein [Pyrinomonadaceae bacterium]
MDNGSHLCQLEQIAAYIDGDLDASACALFEQHLLECRPCNSELYAQRLFMSELDATLTLTPDLPMPNNFARTVAARAASDMSGVRDGIEHRRAFRFCLILALASFALLGAAAGKAVLFSGRTVANQVLGIFGLLGTALYDIAVGLAVISRVISGALVPESPFAGLAALLLALGIVLLSLLISSYHKHHEMRLSE